MRNSARVVRVGGTLGPVKAGTSLLVAPSGGLNPWVVPTAVADDQGNVYVGYADGQSGDIGIAQDDGTSTTSAVLLQAFEADEHDALAILPRASDHKIMAFVTKHNSTPINLLISPNARDISGTWSTTSLDSQLGGTRYTDLQVHQLLDETDDPIWLFYRDEPSAGTDSRWCYSKSTDDGATWAAQTILYHVASSRSYFISWSDNAGTIHFFASTDGSGTKWGHFYYNGGSWFQSDGTDMGSPPFAYTDLTEVWNGNSSAAMNIALDASGNPVIALWDRVTETTHNVWYLRWSGSAWNSTEVVADAGGYQYESGTGGNNGYDCMIDDGDANRMYVIRNVGSQSELHVFVTADGGSTFKDTAITTRSSTLQRRVTTVRNHGATGLRAIWLKGDWTDFNDYSLATLGTDQ